LVWSIHSFTPGPAGLGDHASLYFPHLPSTFPPVLQYKPSKNLNMAGSTGDAAWTLGSLMMPNYQVFIRYICFACVSQALGSRSVLHH
jgi:hypothetical protein